MSLLRNLARRRLRTALTVTGITIGIWALVVFGSMANKISSIVAIGSDYYAGKIVVTDKSGGLSGDSPMAIALVDDIAAIDGVAAAVPGVSTLLRSRVERRDQHARHDRRRPARRRSRQQHVRRPGRPGPRAHRRRRRLPRGRPRFGPRPQARQGHRRHARDPGHDVRRRRDPRADPDRAGHDRDRAARGGPGHLLPGPAAGRPPERAGGPARDRHHGLSRRGNRRRSPRRTDRGRHPERVGDDRHRVRRGRGLIGRDLQRDHRRRRPDQPDRRRPVGDQHDGHDGRRADPGDRDQARDRRLAGAGHP